MESFSKFDCQKIRNISLENLFDDEKSSSFSNSFKSQARIEIVQLTPLTDHSINESFHCGKDREKSAQISIEEENNYQPYQMSKPQNRNLPKFQSFINLNLLGPIIESERMSTHNESIEQNCCYGVPSIISPNKDLLGESDESEIEENLSEELSLSSLGIDVAIPVSHEEYKKFKEEFDDLMEILENIDV